MQASDVIALLNLEPHPEGGYFRETFRDVAPAGTERTAGRAASTAIYFLLEKGVVSRWHKVDAAELWHHYAGAPLALELGRADGTIERLIIGPDLDAGERPQGVVPAHVWQRAESLGAWTLVGCTVAPGFEFSAFEIIDGETPPARPEA